MGKIMGKLKHNYNAFPELETVIWSFPPSFNEFHHNFHILKGTILEQLTMRKKSQQEVSAQQEVEV